MNPEIPQSDQEFIAPETGAIDLVQSQESSDHHHDPKYSEIFQRNCLSYLKTHDSDWFSKNYSGEVSSSGYLIDKDGNETNFLPSQCINNITEIENQSLTEYNDLVSPEPISESGPLSEVKESSSSEKIQEKTGLVTERILAGELPDSQELWLPVANQPELNELGRAMTKIIYPQLVERPEEISKEEDTRLMDGKRGFAQEFVDLARADGSPVRWTRQQGESSFHFNNEEGNRTIEDGFAYFYNKSQSEWRPYQGEIERAYLTIKPELAEGMPKYFVEIVSLLKREGIDFFAKSASPWQAAKRTDTMVFYISPNDKDRAGEIMRSYLESQQAFSGHVLSGKEDEADGLSWGVEPDAEITQKWQQATGSSERISYSQAMALQMAPSVFNAVAQRHFEAGNQEEFAYFRDLAIKATDALAA